MGIMNFIKNPNKRIRLDLQNNFDVNVVNDDLWGAEDITAEEFDMLEVQATQETSGVNTFRQPLPPSTVNDISQVDTVPQQQYELEGKVKILSDSLDKLKKDLLEEKMNREKIVDEKVQEYKKKETLLQKQIEKCESALQFKNQEMKTVYDKVFALEMQLKGKKVGREPSTSKSPSKFLEKFNFNVKASSESSKIIQQQKTLISHRKHRLSIDTPQGKSQGCNIVSSMLCNKLPSVQNPYVSALLQAQTGSEISSLNYSQLSAMSITRITMEQESNEIFHYSYSILKQFLTYLKTFVDKSTTKSNSPVSVRKKDLDKTIVISCLKDLSFILSCPSFFGVVNKLDIEDKTLGKYKKDVSENMDVENTASTSILFSDRRSKNHVKKTHSLLQLLFKLGIPDNYPNEYLKQEEIEWSLAALMSWSLADIKNHQLNATKFYRMRPLRTEQEYHSCYKLAKCSIMDFLYLLNLSNVITSGIVPFIPNLIIVLDSFNEQIIHSHINKFYSITACYIVLKLMIQLSTHKEYLPKLLHNNDVCHLCSVGVLLLRKISACPLEYITLMIVVIDYLSAVFTTHSFSDIRLGSAPCTAMILQGLMCALRKFCKIKEQHCDAYLILQKGFSLLHYLSRYVPNFKERRKAFEDLFISLVWEMLTMGKENPLFKDFYDLAHELWDFQEDMSEFDVEDSADDSIPTVDASSQSDS